MRIVRADQEAVAAQNPAAPRQSDQALGEFEEILGVVVQIPVEPGDIAVLAIGVVVALLGAAEFVAAQHHRGALREQQRGQHVAFLAIAQGEDGLVVGGPFHAAIPARVVVGAVTTVLAVGLVVLVGIRDQIVQCESVVTCDEVHALLRFALMMRVYVGAAQQPRRQPRHSAVVAFQKAPDIVAEAAVPLQPGVAGEAAHLVESCRIPGFRDQLGSGQLRI